MSDPNFVILYVANPQASATFYTELLGRPPVDSSPGFAMFSLKPGFMLGLWAKRDVQPAAVAAGGGSEIAIDMENAASLDAAYTTWKNRGLPIAQPPTDMVFGRTFVALDPNGHRLRAFVPAALAKAA